MTQSGVETILKAKEVQTAKIISQRKGIGRQKQDQRDQPCSLDKIIMFIIVIKSKPIKLFYLDRS